MPFSSAWNAGHAFGAMLRSAMAPSPPPYTGPPCCPIPGARWVGPTLRVVKQGNVSGTVTHAAWLLEAPDMNAVAAVLTELEHRLISGRPSTPTYQGYSGFSRDFTTPTIQDPYTPSLHGSVDWWRSGEQAKNRSRNATTSILRNTIDQIVQPPDENPDGPDAPVAPSLTDQLLRIGTGVLIAGAISGGIYAIYRLGKNDETDAPTYAPPAPRRVNALPSWHSR